MWYESNIFLILVLVGAFFVWRFLEGRVSSGEGSGEDSKYYITCQQRIQEMEERFFERIAEYEGKIKTQETQYEQLLAERDSQHRIALQEQSRRIDFLVEQLREAGVRIRGLEMELGQFTRSDGNQLLPAKPLLIICGPDTGMCDNDRAALRRAGVSFQRLYHASADIIIDELRRRRQDGTLYPWLHVTAHGDDSGIHLGNRVLDGRWWREQLSGIQLVFLAACKTSKVADEIAGIVTVVYVNNEEIDNRDASDFTYAFWRRMVEHSDPQRAYRQAINEVPQVAEYTDIRFG